MTGEQDIAIICCFPVGGKLCIDRLHGFVRRKKESAMVSACFIGISDIEITEPLRIFGCTTDHYTIQDLSVFPLFLTDGKGNTVIVVDRARSIIIGSNTFIPHFVQHGCNVPLIVRSAGERRGDLAEVAGHFSGSIQQHIIAVYETSEETGFVVFVIIIINFDIFGIRRFLLLGVIIRCRCS